MPKVTHKVTEAGLKPSASVCPCTATYSKVLGPRCLPLCGLLIHGKRNISGRNFRVLRPPSWAGPAVRLEMSLARRPSHGCTNLPLTGKAQGIFLRKTQACFPLTWPTRWIHRIVPFMLRQLFRNLDSPLFSTPTVPASSPAPLSPDRLLPDGPPGHFLLG